MTILVERTIEYRGGSHREPLMRFDTLSQAQAWVRREYRGCKSEGPVYIDTKSRGTFQTGRIYRRKGEGRHWVTFSRVLSETERTAESVDITRKPA
jgi:hypothetical protein